MLISSKNARRNPNHFIGTEHVENHLLFRQQIWRQIEGNSCAKSVTKRHYFISKFRCCVKKLISTQDTNWRAVLIFGSVFRLVLRLCLTPERMRTALTLNHWTRKSTALWPPSLLTAEEQMCGNAILSMEHQIPKKKFKHLFLFPNLEFHLVLCYKIKCFKNRKVHLLLCILWYARRSPTSMERENIILICKAFKNKASSVHHLNVSLVLEKWNKMYHLK